MLEGIGVLRNVRSEYGKAIRKQYEKGEFKISRHEFLKKEIREDGISNTIDSVQKDNMLAVEVKEATKQGFAVARGWRDAVNFAFPSSETRRGRVSKDMANTLDTQCNQGIFVKISPELTVYAVWYPKKQCYVAIRRLTPKECFRLQGVPDEMFERAEFVNSDSQLYKQAGNACTVNVIYDITKRMGGKHESIR